MENQRACANREALPVKSHHYEFGTFNERLAHFCALFEIDPPDMVFEGGKPTLTDALLDWINAHNAKMDWLFAGSPDAMLRAWAKDRANERKMLNINRQLEPEVQAGLLTLLRAVVEHDLPIEESWEVFGEVVKDWRAKKAA